MTTSAEQGYAAAVLGWAGHLRAGGTTPWATWVHELPTTTATTSTGTLPDAVHLELLRRLNERAGASSADTSAGTAADVVLGTPSPGRGLVDVPLPWPGHEPSFGTPAIDPARLPSEELVRLAAGVLTRLLPGVHLTPEAPAPDRWPLPWRPRFRVHGAPLTADVVRRGLTAAGAVESDWRPLHLVVARPVEQLVAEHWTASTRAGSTLRWSAVWRRARAADRLPGPVDVAALASRLHGQGADVHVLVAPDAETATRLAAPLLGVRPPPTPPAGGVVDLPGSDLLRRVNRLAALGESPRATTERLVQVLSEIPRTGTAPPPQAPRASRDWAARAAARLAEDLAGADYPVHGDLAALKPAPPGGPRRSGAWAVDPDHTLEVTLAACLRTLHHLSDPADPTDPADPSERTRPT